MSDPHTHDTVASSRRRRDADGSRVAPRHDADGPDDTVVSARRRADGSAIAETVRRSASETDDTLLAERRRIAPARADGTALDDTVPRTPSHPGRSSYQPDAARLRDPAPPRATPPALAEHRHAPVHPEAPREHESLDRERIERVTGQQARRRMVWLLCACAAVAAAAGALLLLLPS